MLTSAEVFHYLWLTINVGYLFVLTDVLGLKRFVSYGKLLVSEPKSAFSIPSHLIFTSAYVVGSFLLSSSVIYYAKWENVNSTFWIWSAMFLFQLLRRLFECLYIHKFSEKWGHILQLPSAWFFYICVILAMTSTLASNNYEPSKYQIILSIVLFLLGSFSQHRCHVILADQRKEGPKGKITEKYVIPKGFLFEYLSCPHYFSEITVYTAFLILVPNSTTNWLIWNFVAVNLSSTAFQTHHWYHTQFKNYPLERTAIIPFLF